MKKEEEAEGRDLLMAVFVEVVYGEVLMGTELGSGRWKVEAPWRLGFAGFQP